MAYKVLRGVACDADLEAIFEFLVRSYQDLGDPADRAFERAEHRLLGIEDDLAALGDIPHQGTLDPALLPGLRHVTKNRAVFYFVTDDGRREVRVLAVFFGAQDHLSHILARIRGDRL